MMPVLERLGTHYNDGLGGQRPLVGCVVQSWDCRTYVRYDPTMTKMPSPELVENRRRSIAMLPPGAPALNRDEALELLGQLQAALLELRTLRDVGP
jgi:hypothetical protein